MAENPESTTRDEFRVVLRGYDRDEVEAFVREAADRIDALEKERAALVARLGEGGTDDREGEIDAVTSEISRILHSAHEAAEGMRSRASQDAAAWRADADAEATTTTEEAQQAAEGVRGDAWESASQLLEQVKAYGARLTGDAEQDALNIRAESEREASRHAAAARQEAEELQRQARLEADRLTEDARRQSQSLIEAASLEADAAQERARALEERRAELMAELDVAQEAIAKLEGDLRTRKEALRAAGNFEDTSTVRVVVEDDKDHWFDDDETVRVVAADIALAEPEPVDAVELADEVRELREKREQAESAVAKLLSEVKGEAPEPSADTDTEEDTAGDEEAKAEVEAATEVVSEAEEQAPEPEPVAEEAPAPATAVATASAAPGGDRVDSLFAALRGDAAPTAPESDASVADARARTATAIAAKSSGVDPFELRDRLLLPVTNQALRSIKKALVELQNETLEELREEGDGWRPDRAVFEGKFRHDLEGLAHDALLAGYAASAELTGTGASPHPDNVAPTNPTTEVAGSLFADVDAEAQRATASGSAHRQATAAVSRVFRTWRTDAAERHLRAASLAAYHDGVLWGLEALEVPSVKGVADGRMCAECPASVATSWSPTDSTPKGTGIPPVHLDCACTIVPD